jgi:hypothetical protein
MDPPISEAHPTKGEQVLEQTARVLQPLVHLLLEHGVTYPQMAETLKRVFIATAEKEGARPGRHVTDSRLAITTGIQRKDIKRLRDAADQPTAHTRAEPRQSIAAVVFTKWLTDRNYCDQDGRPLLLPRQGSERSFEALVKSISKDVHPRTVLNELTRLQMAQVEDDQVRLNADAFVPNPDFEQMLSYLGANLHDHAAAATHNVLGGAPPYLEQSIYSDAVDAAAIGDLIAMARGEWGRVLKTVVPEIARHELIDPEPAPPGPDGKSGVPSVRIRLGMYFFAEPEGPPVKTAASKSIISNRRKAS